MSRWSEREIARKLAERGDELEPPAGLLEKIKSEIPPMIPVGTGVPEIDRRPAMPPRQRWLIAASVVMVVGAGLLVLHRTEVPPVEETARAAVSLRAPSPRREAPLSTPAAPPAARRSVLEPAPAPQGAPAPKSLPPEEEKKLKSLSYVSPSVEGSVRGGVAGGVEGGVPGAAPAAPPVAAPAPPAEAQVDKPVITAESPLLDERRAGTGTSQPSAGATVSQTELEKIPTARDPWTVLQSTPGVLTDRINVGGNESGQQSRYVGPGTANQPRDTGTASYNRVSKSIAAGKLPDPAAVRVGEILNAFDTGGAPPVEGASTPFVHGPQYRLLRIHAASPAQVSFNPSVVVRYRLIGSGASVLYEIELRPDVSPQDALVAVLHLGNQVKAVTVAALDSPWDQASPGFRLSALAAEFAEILKSPAVDASALHRLSSEIGKLPKGPKVSELGEMVERAGRIQQGR